MFDAISDTLSGPAEILVTDNRIASIERSVERPFGDGLIAAVQADERPGVARAQGLDSVPIGCVGDHQLSQDAVYRDVLAA